MGRDFVFYQYVLPLNNNVMNKDLHDHRFPGEASEYRDARNKLLEAELELRDQMEEIAQMRRDLPLGGELKEDYIFEELIHNNGNKKLIYSKLSELFNPPRSTLIIYNYMYSSTMATPCVMCTSILDAMDGTAQHLSQRVNLVVVAKSPISRITRFANNRGWKNLRILSSEKNNYNRDYFGEYPDGSQWPACNVFVKRETGIFHTYATELLFVQSEMQARHLDLMWPLWNFLDITPEGRGNDWYPKLAYD